MEHGVALITTGAGEYKPDEYAYGKHIPGDDPPGDRLGLMLSGELDPAKREQRGLHPVRGFARTGAPLLLQGLLHPQRGDRAAPQGEEPRLPGDDPLPRHPHLRRPRAACTRRPAARGCSSCATTWTASRWSGRTATSSRSRWRDHVLGRDLVPDGRPGGPGHGHRQPQGRGPGPDVQGAPGRGTAGSWRPTRSSGRWTSPPTACSWPAWPTTPSPWRRRWPRPRPR